MDVRRRLATREELLAGEEQMKRAQERLAVEALERGEQAIEDVQHASQEKEVQNGGQVVGVPKEEVTARSTTPHLEHAARPRSLPLSVPPPSQPPAVSPEDLLGSTFRTPQTKPEAKGPTMQGALEDSQLRNQSVATGQRSLEQGSEVGFQGPRGGEDPGGPGSLTATPQVSLLPLFTDEQLRQSAFMPPGSMLSGLTPQLYRPTFLQQEEERMRSLGVLQSFGYSTMNFGDQSAREDLRQLVDEVMVENRRLRQRLYQVESKLQEGDVRFSTPESQKEAADPQRQEAGGPRREEAADPQRQEAGGPRREEAADPQSQEAGSFREKEAEDPPKERSPKSGEDSPQQPNAAFTEKSIEFMKLMMDSMREMQKRMTESKEESGMIRGVEVIRSGSPDLPALSPWEPQHGPLILGDWMLLAEPIISDLSMSASEWWKTVVRLAEEWYKVHMTLNPIERIQHPATVPVEVSQDKWQRVERRVSSMMLQAVPPPVRDELVSARRMSTFGILTHLMVTYSPGGVTEKQNILRSLEDPPEIQKISEGPTALRRWLRWRARAREIGAVAPDPALQLKGLLRMTKRVLDQRASV